MTDTPQTAAPKKRKRRIGFGLPLALLVVGLIALTGFIVPRVDAQRNAIVPHDPYPVSTAAESLHSTLRVADLHADTLLWRRNPLRRQHRGHVDLMRLREGRVRVQVFGVVTKSPKGLNFDENDGTGTDQITQLAIAQFWPPRTWTSLLQRALYQAERLEAVAARDPAFIIARTQSNFADALKMGDTIGLLATEGAHALEGDLANIDRLYDAGFRIMGLQHFFDNAVGGSMHGMSKSGLTEFGREAVAKMLSKDMIIDVAHSSEAVVRDVLAMTDRPVIISHGGLRSHCPRTANRNLPDDVVQAIAARGGIIGIGYFKGAICDISPKGIAAAIVHAIDVLGVDHVALGSDFDGAVTTSLDTSELAAITHELLERGIPAADIRKVMGETVITFFLTHLPE